MRSATSSARRQKSTASSPFPCRPCQRPIRASASTSSWHGASATKGDGPVEGGVAGEVAGRSAPAFRTRRRPGWSTRRHDRRRSGQALWSSRWQRRRSPPRNAGTRPAVPAHQHVEARTDLSARRRGPRASAACCRSPVADSVRPYREGRGDTRTGVSRRAPARHRPYGSSGRRGASRSRCRRPRLRPAVRGPRSPGRGPRARAPAHGEQVVVQRFAD